MNQLAHADNSPEESANVTHMLKTKMKNELVRPHLSREKAVAVEKEIKLAMEAVAERHNLKISHHDARKREMEISLNFSLSIIDELGLDQGARDYLSLSSRINLDPSWLGTCFPANKKQYTITGLVMMDNVMKVRLISNGVTQYAKADQVISLMKKHLTKKKPYLSQLAEQVQAAMGMRIGNNNKLETQE